MATIQSKFKRAGIWFCFAVIGVVAAGCAKPPSAGDYLAAKDRIISAYKTDSAKCVEEIGHAHDVCIQRAEGDQSVALAELAFQYSGKPEDRARVALAKSDASYRVAKTMCEQQTGGARSACLKEAETARIQANAGAQVSRTDGKTAAGKG